MTFGLLGWPWPKPDPVTAATQRWLDQEARAEQTARAALLELQVRYADLDAELRERNRAYGRASATIGALRGDLARERAAARRKASSGWYFHLSTAEPRPADEPIAEWEQSAHDATIAAAMQRHPSGAADPADTAKVGDADPTAAHLSRDCPAEDDDWWCTRDRHQHGQHVAGTNALVVAVWPNDADAALVATAERLGDEVGQRIVTGAEADALPLGTVLLRVDALEPDTHAVVKIHGGWWSFESQYPDPLMSDLPFAVLYVPGDQRTREVRPLAARRDRQAAIDGAAVTLRAHMHRQAHSWGSDRCACGWWGPDHVQHVAEQLAAVGALGTFAPAKKVTIDDVEALARVLNAGDQRFDDLPAWDALADEGRHTYRRLAQYVLRAGYRTRGAHPGPTPRTGSFADGGKRTFADGDD